MAFSSNRRQALSGLGGLAALWAIPTVAGAQAAQAVLTWTPRALSPGQARTLEIVAELIVPATDTPGAREAGVPKAIDGWLIDYCPPAQAAAIKAGLDRIDADARAAHGMAFVAISPAQQAAILAAHDGGPRPSAAQQVGRGETETGLSNRAAQPAPVKAPPPAVAPFFPALKDLVTAGYFTSQLGATKAVRYDPVPGAYHGCIPLKQIGRAWAT